MKKITNTKKNINTGSNTGVLTLLGCLFLGAPIIFYRSLMAMLTYPHDDRYSIFFSVVTLIVGIIVCAFMMYLTSDDQEKTQSQTTHQHGHNGRQHE